MYQPMYCKLFHLCHETEHLQSNNYFALLKGVAITYPVFKILLSSLRNAKLEIKIMLEEVTFPFRKLGKISSN